MPRRASRARPCALGYAASVGLLPVISSLFREAVGWRVFFAVGIVPAGVGLTVVPRLGIAAVPLKNPSVARSIGLLTRRDQPLTPAAAALARLLTASLRAEG